jgi:hypothetical protein
MRTVIKIILTIVALFIATPIFALTKEVPFLKLILTAGLVGGLIAIWRYNPDKKSESTEVTKTDDVDKHQLDKS